MLTILARDIQFGVRQLRRSPAFTLVALLALAGPSQLLEVVAPGRSDRAMAKRRIAEAAEQVPAAAAVKYAIESMSAAAVP